MAYTHVIHALLLMAGWWGMWAAGDRYSDPFWDLRGRPYCEQRVGPKCCQHREDECSVPILGTLCYCDQFCNSTANDCCPDYRPYCLGETPPPEPTINKECYYNGMRYRPGDRFLLNCNDCECVDRTSDARYPHMEILCQRDKCAVERDAVAQANEMFRLRRQTWEASNQTQFWGETLDKAVRFKLGTLHSRRKVTIMRPLNVVPSRNLPREFDARTKWPGLISAPEDQGWCGSSWVYSTVGVASDRWAIMSKGRMREGLSYQHLLGCNSRNQRGCQGGHLTRAWTYIRKFGLVSKPCYKYTGSSTRCHVPKHLNATEARCEGSREKQPLYRVTPVYRIEGEDRIRTEIMDKGPVQATMRVFPDLFSYCRGVYTCPPARGRDKTGFHSVRIIGWGEESIHGSLVKYWLIANSWGREWGEEGLMRLRRGTNECGIEELVLAAWADTSKPIHRHRYLLDNTLDNSIL